MKIAVPIAVKSLGSALHLIQRAGKRADFIELRLDYAVKLSESDLRMLFSRCRKPVIATNRSKKEGGFFEGSEKERLFLLKEAVSFGVEFVDIEFRSGANAIKDILKKKGLTKIILSYHDFKKTPSFGELKKLLKKMAAFKPDIVKIACFAKTEKDNETMILLIEEAKKMGIDIIAFCMGKKGKYSRIHSCEFGAFLTFASLGKGIETAKGQITVEKMRAYSEEFG